MAKRIHWYRFGQKKGAYLSRSISFLYLFQTDYPLRAPYFKFSIKRYKYIDWIHYVDRDETMQTYRRLARVILRVRSLNVFYQYSKKRYEQFQRFVRKLPKKNDTRIRNTYLAKLFEAFVSKKGPVECDVPTGNFLVRTLSQEVEQRAKTYFRTLDDEEVKKKLLILSYNPRETAFYKREKEILHLASELRKKYPKVFPMSFAELPSVIQRRVARLHKKYDWMNIMFLLWRKMTSADVWQEIREAAKEQPEKKLVALRRNHERASRAQKKLLKHMKPDETFLLFLRLLKDSSWIEAEVVRYFQLSDYLSLPFLQVIAARLSVSFEHLTAMSYQEIIRALRGKPVVPKQVRERRLRMYGIFHDVTKGIYKFVDTKKELDALREEEKSTATDVHGMVASQGKARGRVRIILDVSEMGKFQGGEILVTTMTTPAFVVAMKKAAAIVTNDGGITCHAAIVSRELGKPCVIATKNATEVFKDGDKVEVDAKAGIVRRIK